jgi:hypothetical protein
MKKRVPFFSTLVLLFGGILFAQNEELPEFEDGGSGLLHYKKGSHTYIKNGKLITDICCKPRENSQCSYNVKC